GPINRFSGTVAFHGHAHGGTHEGRTATGIPVLNVSIPVLRRAHPEEPPFVIWEAKREPGATEAGEQPSRTSATLGGAATKGGKAVLKPQRRKDAEEKAGEV